MTNSYIDGFCKTANQYGIDPTALIKLASLDKKAFIWPLLAGIAPVAGIAAYAWLRNRYPGQKNIAPMARNDYMQKHMPGGIQGIKYIDDNSRNALARSGGQTTFGLNR